MWFGWTSALRVYELGIAATLAARRVDVNVGLTKLAYDTSQHLVE